MERNFIFIPSSLKKICQFSSKHFDGWEQKRAGILIQTLAWQPTILAFSATFFPCFRFLASLLISLTTNAVSPKVQRQLKIDLHKEVKHKPISQ